jgi:hypothetical protein
MKGRGESPFMTLIMENGGTLPRCDSFFIFWKRGRVKGFHPIENSQVVGK